MVKTSFLNPQQLEAVFHIEGPLLVLAGAGSGKTGIVTYRIAHLLEIGVPASEILALTFTNKAAEEMRLRVKNLTDHYVLTSTFHSLGARILREAIHYLGYSNDFTIYDEEDSLELIKSILKNLEAGLEKSILKSIKSAISQAKNNLLSPYDLTVDEKDKTSFLVKEIFTFYQEKLKQYNALDFDDLLYLTVRLFENHPDILKSYQNRWTFLLVDEYQDTNHAQYMMTNLLAKKHRNLCVVGDPDQSIYSWRGANIHNILNFEKDYPEAKRVNLEQNYRSTNHILKAANALIRHNFSRLEKSLWSDKGNGDKIGVYIAETEKEEALFVIQMLNKHQKEGVSLNDSVIFYRTNSQSRIFEDMLLKYQIPYMIIGGISFYQRREIKDILSFLRIAVSPSDFLSFTRTINLPKRGIGAKAIASIRSLAEKEQLPIFTFCEKMVCEGFDIKLQSKAKEGIKEYVSLVHQIKNDIQNQISLAELMRRTIENSGYLSYLREDKETYEDRKENLDELITKAAEWQNENNLSRIEDFLEELSLKATSEEKQSSHCVQLMTLHNGKGLEFSLAFIVGLEEELFPHSNVKDSLEGIEEERRLFYVGITRAKKHLYLTSSQYRYIWGTPRMMRPSRFLKEIPKEHIIFLHEASEDFFSNNHEEDFSTGDVVLHKDFGRGMIREIYQTSLGTTFDVFFEESKVIRSLVAKYAKLKKI